MRESMMKFGQVTPPALRRLQRAAVLGIAAIGLSGCVVYPSQYGYGYGGYAQPAYVAAPVVVGVGGGWGWGGGWGRRGWR